MNTDVPNFAGLSGRASFDGRAKLAEHRTATAGRRIAVPTRGIGG